MNKKAIKDAFPHTLPIMFGYIAIGISLGLLMQIHGYAWYWSLLSSVLIYAGAMQFATLPLLLQPFRPLEAFILTLTLNARYAFYSLSLVDRFKGIGPLKYYLAYANSDETYSLFLSAEPSEGVDRNAFYYYLGLLDQIYWFVGTALGGLIGNLIKFNTEGIDFAMTALFITIVVGQLKNYKTRPATIMGLIVSTICLILFGETYFILASMAVILVIGLIVSKRREDVDEA